jgi:hypothetical protein
VREPMKKFVVVIIALLISTNVFPQSFQKLIVSGGLMYPQSNHMGGSFSAEYEKQLSPSLSLYCYTGIVSWDQNIVHTIPSPELTSYSENAHSLYPFYGGVRLIISTIKTFKMFADFELGYNYLVYNSYNNIVVEEPGTNKIIDFYPDYGSKKRESESLFGFGAGLGFLQPLTHKIGLYFECKRSTLMKRINDPMVNYSLNSGIFYNI